jgi:hypothetical protein
MYQWLFQRAKDQCPVRPGTGIGDVEVVAAGLGNEAAVAGRAGRTVGRYPIAETTIAADEPPVVTFGVVPAVHPFAVDQ